MVERKVAVNVRNRLESLNRRCGSVWVLDSGRTLGFGRELPRTWLPLRTQNKVGFRSAFQLQSALSRPVSSAK